MRRKYVSGMKYFLLMYASLHFYLYYSAIYYFVGYIELH